MKYSIQQTGGIQQEHTMLCVGTPNKQTRKQRNKRDEEER